MYFPIFIKIFGFKFFGIFGFFENLENKVDNLLPLVEKSISVVSRHLEELAKIKQNLTQTLSEMNATRVEIISNLVKFENRG